MYILFIIAFLVIIIMYILFRNNNVNEGMEESNNITNDEAIQNIASLYNKDQMKVTNLEVTDTLTNPNISNLKATLEDKILTNAQRLTDANARMEAIEAKFANYPKIGETISLFIPSTNANWNRVPIYIKRGFP